MQNMFPLQNNIKNIIFDLGGVILNIDYNLTAEAFKKLGLKDFEEKYSQAKQSRLFDKLETGEILASDFRKELKSYIGDTVSDEDLDSAWNAMLLDLPTERIELLKNLKNNYRLFLLSNTNAIHHKAYSDAMQITYGNADFSSVFEKQYLSFQLGLRKPDKEIFELVLTENNLTASETIFIDDSIQHVEGARGAGLTAYHLQPGESILELFR
jgi:FMN phosphatase YigB (HAD superfamily)